MKRNPLAMGVLVCLTTIAVPGWGMGFCPPPRVAPTLRQELDRSEAAFIGVVCQVHEDADGNGTTEFHIEHVLKSHPILGRKKIVYLPMVLRPPEKGPSQFLIFADVFEGKIDVDNRVPITAAAVRYLQGLLALKNKDDEAALRYCFDHLEDTDEVIAKDAHSEFAQAENADIIRAADSFSPRKLRDWLTTPKMPLARLNLYGRLLGYCGKARDAELLDGLVRKIVREQKDVAVDGLLSGCILLDRRIGWPCLREWIRDSSRSFQLRYSVLRTLRFFHDNHPDVIPHRNIIAAMEQLIEHSDMADLPMEDLRKWQCWDLTDRILALDAVKSHNVPIIQRSILRYALQCPGAKTAAFVAEVRKQNPELVSDQEELLKLEADATGEK